VLKVITYIFVIWEFHSPGKFLNLSNSARLGKLFYFNSSTRQANFCTLGIPLTRQIFVLQEFHSPCKLFVYYLGIPLARYIICTLGNLVAG
jgi:hypothetical protein